jgi:hypothetical protein
MPQTKAGQRSRAGTPRRRGAQATRSAARKPARASRRKTSPSSNGNRNGLVGTLRGVGSTVGTAAEKAGVPALVGTATAAAIAGGVAMRSRSTTRGSTMPARALRSTADEVAKIGKEVGRAGLRIGVGEVDLEVRKSGGDSKSRQSPIEGLLTALTSRRAAR